MNMFSFGLCAKARPALLLKGPFFLAGPAYQAATCRQLSALNRVKISHANNLALVITKRQIQFKPSERKLPVQLSRNNWDKVPSDFELVYQNSLKNWIWGYYITQTVMVSGCCLFAFYELQDLLNTLSKRDLQLAFVCCSIFFLSFAFYNVFASRACIRIYYNSQTGQFVAVRRTFWGHLRKIFYTPSDVTVCDKNIGDAEAKIIIKVKGKKFNLLSDDFESPIFFNMHCYNAGERN
ncbi:unnamed protein product [Candidula unifasciata]|uniref:Transmembrane protein 186 n=1 Tax=Candidula unifasciata TaxID=100452 RepID=A0A8S3YYM9_9EUPU|nr:unnamed protein product [Candidula unifasciata]